jgi:hypothetical protein
MRENRSIERRRGLLLNLWLGRWAWLFSLSRARARTRIG